jgi:hypothetical protein
VEITFQPGETGPKSIDIDLVDDEILEDTERFTVFLRPTTPRVKAGRPASVQILDNEGDILIIFVALVNWAERRCFSFVDPITTCPHATLQL